MLCREHRLSNKVFMLNFRKIAISDKEAYIKMASDFYSSDAVLIHVGKEHFLRTFDELIRSEQYAECYIFELDSSVVGYSLLAKTYSQEAGGLVLWVEEIYVLPEHRGCGIGSAFLSHLISSREESIKRIRLEVEEANSGAIKLYRSLGFTPLDYGQMIIDFN